MREMRRVAGESGAARFHGSDHDAGAIRMSLANAARAGVAAMTEFKQCPISKRTAPDGPPGLVIVNPPYGGRIGDKTHLTSLYRAIGKTLRAQFAGWRVGLVTNEASLAEATGLPFAPPAGPIAHGGLRVMLFQTAKLT
jgi:putative N6-adenine-specific DNA methylase